MYAPRAKQIYQQLGVDHTQKTIIYSDSLNVEKALRLKTQCEEVGFKCMSTVSRRVSPVTDMIVRRRIWYWDITHERLQEEVERGLAKEQSAEHGDQAVIGGRQADSQDQRRDYQGT